MKKYILIIFYEKTTSIHTALNKVFDGVQFSISLESDKHVLSIRTKDNLSTVKKKLIKTFREETVFFVMDVESVGKGFEMNYTALAPLLLMNGEVEVTEQTQIRDEDLTLDDLLELMRKNGFSSLTDSQKLLLKNLSENL